jgi:type I restriction enzyme, R subunit
MSTTNRYGISSGFLKDEAGAFYDRLETIARSKGSDGAADFVLTGVNPKDKFKIGIRKLIERLLIQRLGENDKIVTRYVEDQDFQNAAFDGLADEIFDSVLAGHS